MKTLFDHKKFDELVQLNLDSNSIGELVRKGTKMFYGYDGNGEYHEAGSRQAVAYILACQAMGINSGRF